MWTPDEKCLTPPERWSSFVDVNTEKITLTRSELLARRAEFEGRINARTLAIVTRDGGKTFELAPQSAPARVEGPALMAGGEGRLEVGPCYSARRGAVLR